MYLRYKKFRSSGIFAHPAGSSDLLSSWASKAFRIANLWRIHGDAGWKICFGQIKKEENKLQLGSSCQRPNENFEGFADSVIQMELMENACPQAAYSFKLELAKDQFIQGEGFQIQSSGC